MIEMIHRSKLEPHPDNPRKDLGDLSELAASIRRSGLLQNLTVVPHPDKEGMYRIIIGHRRFAASALAEIDELPCAIEEMSYADQVATMLAENMQRNDLTIADQVSGVQLMLDLGADVKGIAEKTGLSETSVRKRATIATLPKDEMKLAADKGATLIDLIEVTKIEDPKKQEEVLMSFGTNNFTYALRNAKEEEQKKKFSDKVMPLVTEHFPGIRKMDDSSSDAYNGHYRKIWDSYWKDEELHVFPEMENGAKYRYINSGYLISVYKENADWVKSKDKERDEKAKLKQRVEMAKELNRKAFELRSEFVRHYSLNTKAQYSEFYETLMNIAFQWSGMNKSLSYGKYGWDVRVMREILGVPYEDDRDKAESFEHEMERRKVKRASYLLAWAICGGITSTTERESGYISTYNAVWNQNENLDDTYKLLMALGYQMSDFEKSLKDGTHEFFGGRK